MEIAKIFAGAIGFPLLVLCLASLWVMDKAMDKKLSVTNMPVINFNVYSTLFLVTLILASICLGLILA